VVKNSTWVPYAGENALLLALVLLFAAVLLAYSGTKLRRPVVVKRPGRAVRAFMIAIWALSIYTFLVAVSTYAAQWHQVQLPTTDYPRNRIAPVTMLATVATFLIVLYITRKYGWKTSLGSAFVGAATAPMIFELPFDLIVMGRTYPPIPPSPILYRELFFFPLFLVEVSTISLLTLLPSMKISKYTLYSAAGMFFVFAVWALFGFRFPADWTAYSLNASSKILGFVTVITLFVDNISPDSIRSVVSKTPVSG
jgi:hypothetical protein